MPTDELPIGPLKFGDELVPHSLEPQLRGLGLPTKLDKAVVSLVGDFTVCEAGAVLTPEQARILVGYPVNCHRHIFD